MNTTTPNSHHSDNKRLGGKLATYLGAAGAAGTVLASEAQAIIVTDNFGGVPQTVGINGEVNIDFNSDGQVDFQIDHDRYNLNGQDLDFLQIDKNDNNGASPGEDIFNINFGSGTFPVNGTPANATSGSAYVTDAPGNALGYYPLALEEGEMIGPSRFFDFQEGDNFDSGNYIRVNRLIDEDATQIDADAGLQVLNSLPDTPHWTGLGGEVRYLGMQMNLNSTGDINYGWIGVRITSDADATAEVTGWAYQDVPGRKILAGQRVPEPSSFILALFGAAAIIGSLWRRRLFGNSRR